jgi:hypothetical protein
MDLTLTMVPIMDNQERVIPTWADILNRAGLGFEVMHERQVVLCAL